MSISLRRRLVVPVVRERVLAVLAACQGSRTAAARSLGIVLKTLERWLVRWRIPVE